jgi:enoyl-[acyl-carrier-protein] reductase (NADH)
MSLVEKLQQTLSAFKECEIIQKQALREILEAVAEEMPELTKRYLDIPHTSFLYARTISFYSAWLALELRAEAKKLEGK